MAKRRVWKGPVPSCDMCKDKILNRFVDGVTKSGPWACMCPSCYKEHGTGLGVGMGQEFTLNGMDVFVKTGG